MLRCYYLRCLLMLGSVFSVAATGTSGAALAPALITPGSVPDYAEVASSPTVKLNGQMTLEAWLYPTGWRSYSSAEKHGLNFMYKGLIGSHIDYMFSLQANGYLCLGNTKGTIGILRPVVPLNQWTHVAVTINEAAGEIRFYVNGVDQGGWGTWGGSLNRYDAIQPSDNALYIGGFWQRGWGYNNDNFIGKMGEMRIWNVARSAAEILGNYNKQLNGNESGLSAYWNLQSTADKTGHGNTLTLRGSTALQAGQGPDLQTAGSIQVALTQPTNGQVFAQGATPLLSATATSTSGVSKVEFFKNGVFAGQDTNAPFECALSTLTGGVYTLYASATNNAGLSGRSADVVIKVAGPFSGSAFYIPGAFQAEDFNQGGPGVAYLDTTAVNEGRAYRTSEQVDIAADPLASNGFVVGWTQPGEWMEYAINVLTAGEYEVSARVAGVGTGARFHFDLDATNATESISVPNTGAWNAYQWVRKPIVLSAGAHTLRLTLDAVGTGGAVAAFDMFSIDDGSPEVVVAQSAYPSGTPWPAPGSVEAENFDNGGTNAYFDSTAGNEGGAYRTGEAVDIARDGAAGNGYVVGWTKAGEWIEYTLNVSLAGLFAFDARVAGVGTGGMFRFEVQGSNRQEVAGVDVPDTRSWSAYQTVRQSGVYLDAGVQTVRVVMVRNGTSGSVMAFDRFTVLPDGQVAYPLGAPQVVPGVVECENYDLGGQGVAYNDVTPANEGNKYRVSEGVDIAADPGASNGFVVGWTKAGEWMEYTLNVGPVSGFGHWFRVRVAAQGSGGVFMIKLDGTDVSGPIAIPGTGAWNVYTTVTNQLLAGVMSEGIHTVQLYMVQTGVGAAVGAFDQFRVDNIQAVPAPASMSGKLAAKSAVSPEILDVITSQELQQPGSGRAAVDGDKNTIWTGTRGVGGWWLALAYDAPKMLYGLLPDWGCDSLTNVQYLASEDAQHWESLQFPLTNAPVKINYLWVVFPDDGSGRVPAVRELNIR